MKRAYEKFCRFEEKLALVLLAGLAVLIAYDMINERTGDAAAYIAERKTPARWGIYYIM